MSAPLDRDLELERRLQEALGPGFVLERAIGQGGFALVYAARDVGLNRSVAVKVLRPELAGAAAVRERFRREAEAMARLRHPHVIPVYAVGEGGGLAWYVMPLVTGGSLRARLDREPRLPVGEARRILLECAAALAAAHRTGVLHRDIKPDNILLDGDDARVLLTDFGIAKAIGSAGPAGALTATGVVVGTPHYMSPEQASGERGIDHRSDLYSLGVVAYQMLAGEPPFDAASAAALLVKHLTEEPAPITRRRPDCPSDLASAVMRCLAKDPDRRWESADAVRRALEPGGLAVTRPERRSDARAAAGIPEPLHRFRVMLAVAVGAAVVCAVADALLGRVLLGPPGALVAAFVVAAQYGRLWTAGYGWRDVLGRTAVATGARSPVPADSLELGPHRDIVAAMRNDRAAMVAGLARVVRSERALVADLLPAVDAIIGRAVDVATQLHAVERQVDPGPEELERRLTATRGEPPSPGRDQRVAVLERRLETVQGLRARRDALAERLGACAAATAGARHGVERIGTIGAAGAAAEIRAALEAGAGPSVS